MHVGPGHCNPAQKDAHVQQFMWAGKKQNDLGVPLNATGSDKLLQVLTRPLSCRSIQP